MSESSGCDPQLAARARSRPSDEALRRLLVDGERAPDWFTLQRDPGDETDHVDRTDEEIEETDRHLVATISLSEDDVRAARDWLEQHRHGA